ncbi:MAG: LacI family DNA-binding transcriptional regulator [Eubacteriales bacterium]|nr:LacI family DNA-binding transcriptional regulator [Eubacteriales bacterium]
MEKSAKKNAVTQTDIARELNISVVSVSNALGGKRGVSEQLRQRILDAAEELGYRRNNQTETQENGALCIGILISERYLSESVSFYKNIYQEIVRAASDKQIFTVLEILDKEDETKTAMPDMLYKEQLHGILVLGELKKEYIRLMKKESGIPVIFVDFYADVPDTDFVISDGYHGTYQLTRSLIESGYRDIAFVGNIKATSSIMDRYLGYRKAMMEKRLPVCGDRLIKDRKEWDSEIYVELPVELPEAFVCNCDRTAMLVITLLKDRGCLVPENVGVTGFDYFAPDNNSGIRLSTYDVDCRAMARISINALIRKIRHPDSPARVRMVSGQVIMGNSFIRKEE